MTPRRYITREIEKAKAEFLGSVTFVEGEQPFNALDKLTEKIFDLGKEMVTDRLEEIQTTEEREAEWHSALGDVIDML